MRTVQFAYNLGISITWRSSNSNEICIQQTMGKLTRSSSLLLPGAFNVVLLFLLDGINGTGPHFTDLKLYLYN